MPSVDAGFYSGQQQQLPAASQDMALPSLETSLYTGQQLPSASGALSVERAPSSWSQGQIPRAQPAAVAPFDAVTFGNGIQTLPDTSNVGLQLEQLEQQVRDARSTISSTSADLKSMISTNMQHVEAANELPYQVPNEAALPMRKDTEMELDKVQQQQQQQPQLNLLELSRSRRLGNLPEKIKVPAPAANGVRVNQENKATLEKGVDSNTRPLSASKAMLQVAASSELARGLEQIAGIAESTARRNEALMQQLAVYAKKSDMLQQKVDALTVLATRQQQLAQLQAQQLSALQRNADDARKQSEDKIEAERKSVRDEAEKIQSYREGLQYSAASQAAALASAQQVAQEVAQNAHAQTVAAQTQIAQAQARASAAAQAVNAVAQLSQNTAAGTAPGLTEATPSQAPLMAAMSHPFANPFATAFNLGPVTNAQMLQQGGPGHYNPF